MEGKQNKDYLKAIEIGEQLWDWLCDNPTLPKTAWPEYKKYKYFLSTNQCTICNYNNKYSIDYAECIIAEECNIWCKTDERSKQEYYSRLKVWRKLFSERLRIM